MNVKCVLAKLRKERRVIDEAIVALERMLANPHRTKRRVQPSRKEATFSERPTAPNIGEKEGPRDRAQIIDFPRRERTG